MGLGRFFRKKSVLTVRASVLPGRVMVWEGGKWTEVKEARLDRVDKVSVESRDVVKGDALFTRLVVVISDGEAKAVRAEYEFRKDTSRDDTGCEEKLLTALRSGGDLEALVMDAFPVGMEYMRRLVGRVLESLPKYWYP